MKLREALLLPNTLGLDSALAAAAWFTFLGTALGLERAGAASRLAVFPFAPLLLFYWLDRWLDARGPAPPQTTRHRFFARYKGTFLALGLVLGGVELALLFNGHYPLPAHGLVLGVLAVFGAVYVLVTARLPLPVPLRKFATALVFVLAVSVLWALPAIRSGQTEPWLLHTGLFLLLIYLHLRALGAWESDRERSPALLYLAALLVPPAMFFFGALGGMEVAIFLAVPALLGLLDLGVRTGRLPRWGARALVDWTLIVPPLAALFLLA